MRLDVVAKLLDLHARELLVEALDLLQAKNVGLNLLQIGEEVGQPLTDGIDVPGGDAQAQGSLSFKGGAICHGSVEQGESGSESLRPVRILPP